MKNNEIEEKVEVWNGHSIGFVQVNQEWQAVASDVAKAMGFADAHTALRRMPDRYKGRYKVPTLGGGQEVITLTEKGLYRLIMRSNKPEAEDFQDWVYEVIKQLRQASDIEIFDMFDKKNQRIAMSNLKQGLLKPTKLDYIKANTMVDKVVSNKFGFQKMVKKGEMTSEMLAMRARMLPQVVNFIVAYRQLGITTGIAQALYLALDQSAKKVA